MAHSGQVRVGLVVLVPVVGIALLGPLVAPYGETEYVGPPSTTEVPGTRFGTDHLGQDVWSRVLLGGRTLLIVATIATALGLLVGAAIGLSAAIARPAVGHALMRGIDVVLALPQVLVVLVAMTTIGPKAWLVVAAVAFTTAPRVARVLHGAASVVAQQDFVLVSQALGEPRRRLIGTDLLPNVTGALMVEASIRFTYAIGIVASLAFLGFLPRANAADWGVMVQENRATVGLQPWGVALPMVGIAALAIGAGLIADGLSRSVARIGER